jgi:hypothetical protein
LGLALPHPRADSVSATPPKLCPVFPFPIVIYLPFNLVFLFFFDKVWRMGAF